MSETTLLQELAHVYRDLTLAFEQEVGISQSRLQLLCLLQGGSEQSQTALQRQLGLDGAVITRHLRSLEAGGWVERRTSPHDQRVMLVRLGASGERRLAELERRRERFQARIEGALAGSGVAVAEALRRMREAMRTPQPA